MNATLKTKFGVNMNITTIIITYKPNKRVLKIDLKLTKALLNSLGLIHRIKNGEHELSVAMRASSDFLNCAPNVGVRFLVSEPICISVVNKPVKNRLVEVCINCIRSPENVSRFFSRNPWILYSTFPAKCVNPKA